MDHVPRRVNPMHDDAVASPRIDAAVPRCCGVIDIRSRNGSRHMSPDDRRLYAHKPIDSRYPPYHSFSAAAVTRNWLADPSPSSCNNAPPVFMRINTSTLQRTLYGQYSPVETSGHDASPRQSPRRFNESIPDRAAPNPIPDWLQCWALPSRPE